MNELDYTRILQSKTNKNNKQQKMHQYIDKFNAKEHKKTQIFCI